MQPLTPLFILSLGHFFCDFMLGIWPLYKTLAEIDLISAGLIYSVSALIGEGSQLFFGYLSDRGKRNPLILIALCMTCSSLLFPLTRDPVWLCAIFLMTCLGSGAFHPSASGLVVSLTERRKSLFMTFFATFGFLGMAVSQVIFIFVYKNFSGSMYVLALPLILIAFLVPRLPEKRGASAEKSPLRLFAHFFSNRGLRQLYILQVAMQSIYWGSLFLLPDVLKARGHEEWLTYGGGHFLYVVGGVSMLIPSGLLADQFSSKRVLQGGIIVGMAAFFGFLLTPSLSTTMAIPLLFAMGASLSLVNPVSVAFGNKIAPQFPSAVSAFLMGGVWAVSEIIGPGGGALLASQFISDGAAKALILLGLFFPVALVASLFLPEEVADPALKQVE